MKCELLHYEVAWFDIDGKRRTEYFEDVKSAILYSNVLRKHSFDVVVYQLSRVKDWEK